MIVGNTKQITNRFHFCIFGFKFPIYWESRAAWFLKRIIAHNGFHDLIVCLVGALTSLTLSYNLCVVDGKVYDILSKTFCYIWWMYRSDLIHIWKNWNPTKLNKFQIFYHRMQFNSDSCFPICVFRHRHTVSITPYTRRNI